MLETVRTDQVRAKVLAGAPFRDGYAGGGGERRGLRAARRRSGSRRARWRARR